MEELKRYYPGYTEKQHEKCISSVVKMYNLDVTTVTTIIVMNGRRKLAAEEEELYKIIDKDDYDEGDEILIYNKLSKKFNGNLIMRPMDMVEYMKFETPTKQKYDEPSHFYNLMDTFGGYVYDNI